MSKDFVKDIVDMHTKYGFNDKIKDFDTDKLKLLLDFRRKFNNEENTEFNVAVDNLDAEEIVDGLIDTIVVSIGLLDLFEVDTYKAWDRVHEANMTKEVGIKAERPNPLGLPDLIKPEGWIAPNHSDNHGKLGELS